MNSWYLGCQALAMTAFCSPVADTFALGKVAVKVEYLRANLFV